MVIKADWYVWYPPESRHVSNIVYVACRTRPAHSASPPPRTFPFPYRPPILFSQDDADTRAAKLEKEERSLMVHRLPAGTTQEQLLKVMRKKTKIVAVEVEDIEFTGATGKTHVREAYG